MKQSRRSRRTSFIVPILTLLVTGIQAQEFSEFDSAGMSSDRIAQLNHVIQTYVDQGKIAGAVTLVARDGRIVQLHASGYQDIESGERMRTDSIFRLYSMTKPVTSTALLMLFEQGYFQLDDPLDKYIPEFNNVMVFDGMDESGDMGLVKPDRKITIRDVFTHTGGISYGFGDHPVDIAYRDAGLVSGSRKLSAMVKKIASMPLRQQPGSYWHYSFSHDIQAYLVEYFSGMPFDEFIGKTIFAPLGMNDTGYILPESKLGRVTSMYAPVGYVRGKPRPAPEMNEGLKRLETAADSDYLRKNVNPAGGSGLVSTAEDYFRFAEMLVNGGALEGTRLLSPKTVKLMTSPHVPMGFPGLRVRGVGYGLGVSVMVDVTAHGNLGSNGQFGWGGAATTNVIMDPSENLVAILLVQHYPFLGALGQQFPTLVYQALIESNESK
jgi:CubicO group peptidase (beta-lactamase class C family)